MPDLSVLPAPLPVLRPWEVAGTREISDAEREMFAKVEDMLIPLPRGAGIMTWRDLR